jgi:cytochrome c biogenesis protein CcmG/thiol:disulfide interchange protein DsbE
MQRLWPWIPVAVLGLLVGVFLRHFTDGRDPAAIPSALMNQPVPAFHLSVLHGGQASQDIFKGKISIVNFFASWCAPCRAEHPILMGLAKAKDIQMIGIAYKDKSAKVSDLMKELGTPYQKILLDDKGLTGINWGITGVPETFVVDSAGIIRYRFAGPLSADKVDAEIIPLIENIKHE